MDVFTPKERSRLMSRVKGRDSALERRARSYFHAQGLRFRLQHGENRIDVAFPGAKVAVFLDSCYWHYCPRHRQVPASNRAFWLRKLEGNAARDKRVSAKLRREGWKVYRVWEHALKKDPEKTLAPIVREVRARRAAASSPPARPPPRAPRDTRAAAGRRSR